VLGKENRGVSEQVPDGVSTGQADRLARETISTVQTIAPRDFGRTLIAETRIKTSSIA
jgi:hypothetical protein